MTLPPVIVSSCLLKQALQGLYITTVHLGNTHRKIGILWLVVHPRLESLLHRSDSVLEGEQGIVCEATANLE